VNLGLLVNSLILSVFSLGSILLLWDDIELAISRYKLRHRLKVLRIKQKKLPGPFEYIKNVLELSFKTKKKRNAFFAFEAVLLITTLILSNYNCSPLFSLAVSILTAAAPLLILASRFEASRARQSHEGISLVSELHRQYRINNLNMNEAIEKTISSGGDYSLSSERLYGLLIHLRSSAGPIELRDAIDSFVFSFGTAWAKMLGQCIRLSVESGMDVSEGLSDIAVQLKQANKLDEKRRMMNGEASRMTLILVPLMYAVCMLAAIFYLKINVITLIKNQFFNPTGYLLFIGIILLFIVNYLLLFFASHSKLDF